MFIPPLHSRLDARHHFIPEHLVGRADAGARPFRVFEGVNELLDDTVCNVIAGRIGCRDREVAERLLDLHDGRMFATRKPAGLTAVPPHL